ncbi:NPP-16 protein, partial [Aphelenchoides avenae]
CVVFQFKNNEYKKFGVGSLHVKSTDDGKKQLLIRAATTVGTIWVNTLLNDNFKWSKVDDKKMRISYPNEVREKGDEKPKLVMETFLVRVGGQPEMDKIVEHFPKKD